MTTYDPVPSRDERFDPAPELATSKRWSFRAACGSAALAAVLALLALKATIGDSPSDAVAGFRTMFSCRGMKSLDACLHFSAYHKYESGIEEAIASKPSEKTPSLEDFLKKSLDNCSCKRSKTCATADNTLVQALVDIHRGNWDKKRKFGTYTKALYKFFRRYPTTAKVVFIQKGFGQEAISAHPGGVESPYLCLVEIELEELPDFKYAPDWGKAMKAYFSNTGHIGWPQTLVPNYDVLMMSKTSLVARVAEQNPFQSKRFAWVDAGLHFPMTAHLPTDGNVDVMTCGDNGEKVCVGFSLNPPCWKDIWDKKYKDDKALITKECNGCEMGATFSGTREAVLKWVDPFYATVAEYFRDDVVDSDQGVVMTLYLHRKDVVYAAPCNSFEFCAGYILGGHKLENHSKYEWGDCDGKGGVEWLNRVNKAKKEGKTLGEAEKEAEA